MGKHILFGLNRSDFRSPAHFSADAKRLEASGWDYLFIPCSPLLIKDPYVMLAEAIKQTSTIRFGTLIENPIMRNPAVIAGSIATIDDLDPGRVTLGLGVGDTAVRLMGKKPATVKQLHEATNTIRSLLDGDDLDVTAARPAKLRHSNSSPGRPPIWIATQGPKTLRMAGQIADGVFVRVGTHPDNLNKAVEQVHLGARDAGRQPEDIKIAAIFHTILEDDQARCALISRSAAAGYFEYTPSLFEGAGLEWSGPPIEELKSRVWPDFHHASDLEKAGHEVSFLSDEAADAFALNGSISKIMDQLSDILAGGLPIDLVIPHPMPTPSVGGDLSQYSDTLATNLLNKFR